MVPQDWGFIDIFLVETAGFVAGDAAESVGLLGVASWGWRRGTVCPWGTGWCVVRGVDVRHSGFLLKTSVLVESCSWRWWWERLVGSRRPRSTGLGLTLLAMLHLSLVLPAIVLYLLFMEIRHVEMRALVLGRSHTYGYGFPRYILTLVDVEGLLVVWWCCHLTIRQLVVFVCGEDLLHRKQYVMSC